MVVLLDDVGFGASDVFGGPVPMPALRKVAEQGLRYNQFHTTALCSPTRAALLTGRNHHSAHFGAIAEIAVGYPGYDSVIPKSKATVAEVLKGNGYNTAWFGKNHITPMWETSPAGPFDRWPTGLGFERFYGFMGGEASQWEPSLLDQTTPINPHVGKEGYHLTEDLADKAIAWIRHQKTSAPDKPFFIYFAPGATHSPAPCAEGVDRELQGPLRPGLGCAARGDLPAPVGARASSPRARPIRRGRTRCRPGRSTRTKYRPVASRLMEVYAGFLAHVDHHVGRIIEAIEELGAWDNTIFVYIVGDNGASAEGTLHGVWSCPSYQNGVPEDPEWLLEHIDEFGSPACENHYNAAWAWALDAPFQWTKQVASHFGGTRNAMALSWPKGIDEPGGCARSSTTSSTSRPPSWRRPTSRIPTRSTASRRSPSRAPACSTRSPTRTRRARTTRSTSRCSPTGPSTTTAGWPPASTAARPGSARRSCTSTGRRSSGSSTTWRATSASRSTWPRSTRTG